MCQQSKHCCYRCTLVLREAGRYGQGTRLEANRVHPWHLEIPYMAIVDSPLLTLAMLVHNSINKQTGIYYVYRGVWPPLSLECLAAQWKFAQEHPNISIIHNNYCCLRPATIYIMLTLHMKLKSRRMLAFYKHTSLVLCVVDPLIVIFFRGEKQTRNRHSRHLLIYGLYVCLWLAGVHTGEGGGIFPPPSYFFPPPPKNFHSPKWNFCARAITLELNGYKYLQNASKSI